MGSMTVGLLFLFLPMFFFVMAHGDGLSYNFYERSCPQVESIVREALIKLALKDPTTPASLLRLMFHDCQVQGCDASILLDSPNSEMVSAKNFGINHRETIGVIKSLLEEECPRQVSCADILILAARDAVAIAGGPEIRVPLGRRDSASMSYELAEASLPSSNAGVDTMLNIFTSKGMTIDESVAILGAHTLGVTHCRSILDRLSKHDTTNLSFIRLSCPLWLVAANDTFVSNDLTVLNFDNQYFRDVLGGRGVLKIDADMSTDPRTSAILAEFALNQKEFFETFSSAFIKLSRSGVLTQNQGLVRRSCDTVE